jgi:hypothetical protein
LENLLPPNIAQPSIQISNLSCNIFDLALIRTFDLAGLPNSHIQLDLDAAHLLASNNKTTGRMPIRWGKA